MKESPGILGGLTPVRLIMNVAKGISEDDVFGRAAQLAYYFFLALFPLLLFLLSVLGLVAGPDSHLRENLMSMLARFAPSDAGRLISRTVNETFKASGGFKAVVGLLGALWAASAGMGALIGTLNIAFKAKETRPGWKQRAIALGLTVGVSVLIVLSLGLLLLGNTAANYFASAGVVGEGVKWAWMVAQWPIVFALMLVAFGLVYYFAPNVEHPKWHWVTPGAVAGLVLWLGASFALRFYLKFFNNYSATYGSLAAVILVLLWFYLTGASLLIGGEVNSEIEHAAAAHKNVPSLQKPAQAKAA